MRQCLHPRTREPWDNIIPGIVWGPRAPTVFARTMQMAPPPVPDRGPTTPSANNDERQLPCLSEQAEMSATPREDQASPVPPVSDHLDSVHASDLVLQHPVQSPQVASSSVWTRQCPLGDLDFGAGCEEEDNPFGEGIFRSFDEQW